MFYLYFVRSTRYDCTTLYFESFTEDELRRFGYSKDHKFNQGQVLLALMVTKEGLPVGYRVLRTQYKYVVPSKPSKDAIRIYEVLDKKRHVVPFRLTAEV